MAQRFKTPITVEGAAAASSQAVAAKVDGDTQNRVQIDAGGKITWGDGSSAGDANLYRSAANALKTDDTLEAASGLITLTTSGAPTASLSDGALAIDTTNDEFYIRSGGAWVKQGGGGATQSDAAPSNPVAGDLWYETDTGAMYIYYDSAWIEVGTAGVIAMSTTSTPPSSPGNGDLWFDIDTARTYVYYDDGSSQQWIEVGAASAAANGVDGAVQFASGGTFSSDDANLHWDDTNNRLGIGTTSPETPLSIVTTNKLGATFTGTTDGEGVRVDQSNYTAGNYVSLIEGSYDDGATEPHVRIGAMYDGGGSNLAIGTSNSYGSGITNTAMFIDSSGNVGIGTTSPAKKLHVEGGMLLDAYSVGENEGLFFREGFTTIDQPSITVWDMTNSGLSPDGLSINAQDGIRFRENGGEVARFKDGNFGIGTTSPSYKLDVNGDINTTGALRTDGKKTGLVLQASGDFSGVTGVDITNVFTSEFDNYQIHFSNVTNTGQEWIYFRFWQGGSLNSSNLYDNQRLYVQGTTVGAQKDVTISYGKLLPAGGNPSAWVSHISSPNLSNYSLVTSHGLYSDNTNLGYVEINNTVFRSTTAATGIRFGGVSGSYYMTGRWEVYGCPK